MTDEDEPDSGSSGPNEPDGPASKANGGSTDERSESVDIFVSEGSSRAKGSDGSATAGRRRRGRTGRLPSVVSRALAHSARQDAADSTTFSSRLIDFLERHGLALTAAGTTVLVLLLFFYPVATVLVEAVRIDGQWTLDTFREVFATDFYWGLFGFTAYQAALSTLASVALGLPGAYVLARYEFPGRKTIRSLTIVPFVLPAIMVAVGFVATFGQNGTFNALLSALGLPTVELMFTLEIIVIAHAFYNAPLVARIVAAAWESVDARMVETARSLGANPRRAFRDVMVPQLLPAVLTGALLTFIFTFMTFPIVLALGGLELATVEVWIYARIQQLDYTEAAVLAVLETGISLGLTYAYLQYEARMASASRAARPPERVPLVPNFRSLLSPTRLAVVGYLAVVAVVFVGPLASMVLASVTGPDGFTLQYYEFLLARQVEGASFQTKPFLAVRNSLLFGVGTLLVALPMGVTVAFASNGRFRGRRAIEALAMAPLAVSGVVVGLGLLRGLVFGIEIGGTRIQVAGVTAIVAAHAVAAYPFVVRTVSPQLGSLDDSLVESARALGASRARALLDIELPLVAPAVLAGAAFAFAISIGEFDSTVILAAGSDSYTMPVAVERFLGGRTLGPATAMGTVLLLVTAASFVVIERLGGRFQRG